MRRRWLIPIGVLWLVSLGIPARPWVSWLNSHGWSVLVHFGSATVPAPLLWFTALPAFVAIGIGFLFGYHRDWPDLTRFHLLGAAFPGVLALLPYVLTQAGSGHGKFVMLGVFLMVVIGVLLLVVLGGLLWLGAGAAFLNRRFIARRRALCGVADDV